MAALLRVNSTAVLLKANSTAVLLKATVALPQVSTAVHLPANTEVRLQARASTVRRQGSTRNRVGRRSRVDIRASSSMEDRHRRAAIRMEEWMRPWIGSWIRVGRH